MSGEADGQGRGEVAVQAGDLLFSRRDMEGVPLTCHRAVIAFNGTVGTLYNEGICEHCLSDELEYLVYVIVLGIDGLPDVDTKGGKYGHCILGTANGPHVHEYLQEMRNKVLSKYDLLTVGECAGVTIEEAKKYANSEQTELNMVFQFEHSDIDARDTPDGKWYKDKIDLVKYKKILSDWQTELNEVAWNSLYFCNHDQPRIISRLGDDNDEWREKSAKCIATCLHMMQGTPYVYQGEELAMTNYPFKDLSEYRDLESINAYNEWKGTRPEAELLEAIAYKSRDNARTPMQWDDSENAGFTTGKPWINVNPNYTKINAAEQVKRPDSVFNYYKKLIELRRFSEHSDIIVYGDYTLLMPEDDKIFAYTRKLNDKTLVVACNLSGEKAEFFAPEELALNECKQITSNYDGEFLLKNMTLEPWQAVVWGK